MVLVVGFLLLDQFRADLIEARIQSLTIQADIIAAAISASATGDTDSITIDPDKLLQLAPGESVAPSQSDEDAIQFSINPALVGPFLHRLVTPTHTRARIYDSDGRLLLELAIVFGPRRRGALGLAGRVGAARLCRSDHRPPARLFPDLGRAANRRPVGHQWQDDAGSRRRAAGQNAISRARQRRGRDDRVGGRADPTHDGDPRRASTFDPGRRHRPRDHFGALGSAAFLPGARGRDAAAVALARQYDRRTGAPARRRRRTRAARHPVATANSRFHRAIGRDRSFVARASRHDAGAVQSS